MEKEIRITYNCCVEQIKLNKQKEKQRAVAMFGGPKKEDGRSAKIVSHKTVNSKSSTSSSAKRDKNEAHVSTLPSNPDVKAVSSISISRKGESDGRMPETDPDEEPSFVEKHKDVLLCVLAGVVGSALIFQATPRRW